MLPKSHFYLLYLISKISFVRRSFCRGEICKILTCQNSFLFKTSAWLSRRIFCNWNFKMQLLNARLQRRFIWWGFLMFSGWTLSFSGIYWVNGIYIYRKYRTCFFFSKSQKLCSVTISQPHKVVKHAETICRKFVNELLFECVWLFCWVGTQTLPLK